MTKIISSNSRSTLASYKRALQNYMRTTTNGQMYYKIEWENSPVSSTPGAFYMFPEIDPGTLKNMSSISTAGYSKPVFFALKFGKIDLLKELCHPVIPTGSGWISPANTAQLNASVS